MSRLLQRGDPCRDLCISMVSDASGWYARLDRECSDRVEQLETWLDSWEEATRHGIPIAATLPNHWPTLPAGLLSDPGAVLDHLLARNEAESDGRSPRGAYATPAKFAESILSDELKDTKEEASKEPSAALSLSALPLCSRRSSAFIRVSICVIMSCISFGGGDAARFSSRSHIASFAWVSCALISST